MSNASRLSELHDRRGSEKPRLQISQIIEEDPAPEFDSVGIELRAHRERKGHEVEMVGRVLRIKPVHVSAIEDSNYSALPGKTYAVGFVRAYAEYLGLDPADCIRRFKLEYDAEMNPPTPEGEEAPRKAKGQLYFPEVKEEMRLPTGSIVILGSILALGVWGGWYLTSSAERDFLATEVVAPPPATEMASADDAAAAMRNQPRAATQEPAAQTAAATTDTDTGTQEPEVAVDTTPTNQAPHAEQLVSVLTGTAAQDAEEDATASDNTGDTSVGEELDARPEPQPEVQTASIVSPRDAQVFGQQNFDARVVVRARANTWVRVEDQTGVLFEETLQNGDSYMVPNRVGVIMATRNAGAVELLLDGQSLGPVGAVGQPVIETTLDAGELASRMPQHP